MEPTTTKSPEVCPFCGNDRFLWIRKAKQAVLIDGSFNEISVYATDVVDYEDDEAMPQPVCGNCQNPVPGTVTEEFFHTVICDDQYEDTIPFFVDGELLRKYIRRIGQKANAVLEKTESIAVASPSYPFLLLISLTKDEQGIMEVSAKVITHEPATSEHVKPVELDTKVKCPPAVAGRYVFDFEGKTYSVYILQEQYAKDVDAEEIDFESIASLVAGNTIGNTEPAMDDMECFTVLYFKNADPLWYRSSDDRKVRAFIKNLIMNGCKKDEIMILHPISDVDIDDFIQEG